MSAKLSVLLLAFALVDCVTDTRIDPDPSADARSYIHGSDEGTRFITDKFGCILASTRWLDRRPSDVDIALFCGVTQAFAHETLDSISRHTCVTW